MKIVVCGFGSAGYSAAMAIKRYDYKAEIIVIDPKENDLMHPCGLPYALEGVINQEHLVQNLNFHRFGITKIKGIAEKIFHHEKTVAISTLQGKKIESYDKLIIALGCRPFMPSIINLDRYMNSSIYTLTSTGDLDLIKERIKSAARCAIIGGGAIGIETAYALKAQNKDVTIIEMADQLLNGILDNDMAAFAENYLNEAGIKVIKNKKVTGVEGNELLKNIICDEESIPADMAVLAAGFKPELSLAENSGIEFSIDGIKTNEMLLTSAEDVYAAGDCIINYSVIDKKPISSRLATSAYKQGAVAAANALGGNEKYHGSAGTFVTRFGSFEIAGTGFNTAQAALRGYTPVSGKITSKIRPEYYPDNSDITVKIIFDKDTGLVLGAQCAGEEGVAERVNIVSMALEFGITIDALCRTELAYAPSVSEVYDPLFRAADFGLRRMKRDKIK
ncbi:MAG: FAD-dependent oxidoreductase [Leptospirales bacterium]|nr:FAD-dependent oxidoreductase [Leptospirales bacterium]